MTGPGVESNGKAARKPSFLARLARDKRGNTLAMMGMALVPIAGMIGSGLDMSRAFLTKAKLQNACDATALATRRLMGGNVLAESHRVEGRRFFTFNFPPGTMGTSGVVPTIEADPTDPTIVVVTVATAVPTSLMRIFGKQNVEIEVTCNADQDLVHNDVMLVLDVTGSMNCTIGSGRLGCDPEEGNSRIAALKGAAGKLYTALYETDPDIITRFGFMPYAMTTNVARDLNANWIRSPGLYYRRSGSSYTSSSVTQTSDWMTAWKSTSNPGRGCVEERSSYARRTDTNITIDTAVSLEDINWVDTGNANLKWQPYDPDSTDSGQVETCPAPATRLAEYASLTAFNDKVTTSTSLRGGQTHHDVGMMWGLRYLSPTGMFSAANPTMIGTRRVDRHLVFMTDGQMKVDGPFYSHLGIPNARQRVQGPGTHEDRAERRLLSACNRAREMNITVWVIALDVGATDANLRNCAADAQHYFEAETPVALQGVFETIGNSIAKLRLTK